MGSPLECVFCNNALVTEDEIDVVVCENCWEKGTEFFQVVRVDDPLGSPTFTEDYVALGNIDNLTGGVPDAPQSGTSALIDTNDRGLLHAVWRADSIWATTTIVPRTGAISGQATAYWVCIGTSNLDAPVVIEQGEVGGEDIATGTRTFYPSIAVNANLHVAIGFSASAATRFPGAYYAFHAAGDSPGSVGPSVTLRAGSAFYERDLGGSSHRWGDYSSVAVDPVDDCFWIYNEYATTQGNPTDGQSGRWATRFVKSCLAVCGDGPRPRPGSGRCHRGGSSS